MSYSEYFYHRICCRLDVAIMQQIKFLSLLSLSFSLFFIFIRIWVIKANVYGIVVNLLNCFVASYTCINKNFIWLLANHHCGESIIKKYCNTNSTAFLRSMQTKINFMFFIAWSIIISKPCVHRNTLKALKIYCEHKHFFSCL